jgi:hypothetical protein
VVRSRDDEDAEPVDAELVVGGDAAPTRPREREGEPPVVARLMIEIRSDGSRTIARGALEDLLTSQKVGIEARGDSPLSLAMSLARSLTTLPSLARSARSTVRALLPRRRR